MRVNVEKDVDRVHQDQQIALASRIEQHRDGAGAHQEDAVLRDQPVRELGEAPRHPGIDGHVGQDARPVDEPGLRRDEEQRSLRDHGHDDHSRADRKRPELPRPEEVFGQHPVQRLAGEGLRADQEITEQNAPGRERQREGHVQHGLLRVGHPGLPKNLHSVRDSLDAGVRAAAQE